MDDVFNEESTPPMAQKYTKSIPKASSKRFSSVVKLFVKKAPWSYITPWRKETQSSCTGTGFLIDNHFIITNAHVVHRHVNVLVRSQSEKGSPCKYNARVIHISIPCDLAILTVDDASFWKDRSPLSLAPELPELDDDVTCVGYPVGGENISVTRGVVSRIDMNRQHLLRIQIDAAINPGNSGGPVFDSKGNVAGVASSHLKDASNIGFIIPSEVLKLFMSTINMKKFPGVSSLWLPDVQMLESQVLRRHLGIPEEIQGGVRVSAVEPLGPCSEKIRVDDVLLAINDNEIGRDGTVTLRHEERIPFWYLITKELIGSNVRLSLLREGTRLDISVELRAPQYLVPRFDGWDCNPSFFVCGGLVFVPLTKPWALKRKCSSLCSNYSRMVRERDEQIVVLSQILAHEVNFGYHSVDKRVLKHFNGTSIRNLKHLSGLIRTSEEKYFEFKFLMNAQELETDKEPPLLIIVLDAEQCKQTEEELLQQHMIGSNLLL